MNEEKFERKPLLSEGIVVAATPVAAYLFTFAYEAGFCGYFGIPVEFIAFSLTNFFIATGAVFFVLIILYFLADVFLSGLARSGIDARYYVYILMILPWIVSLAIHVFVYGKIWREWIYLLYPLGWFCLVFFLLPLITQRDKKSYAEKLNANIERERELERVQPSLTRLLVPRSGNVGQIVLWVVFCAWMLGEAFYTCGRASALKKKEFYVVNQRPACVVLKIYGENLICAAFDKKKKRIEKNFVVLKVGTDTKIQLRLDKIGPLRPER